MKYEITGETRVVDGVTLHRIRALWDIRREWDLFSVRCGELGGWVESGNNLSQRGSCWVGDEAVVKGNAIVSEDATINDFVIVRDNARVYGRGKVWGRAQVLSNAIICEDARVSEQSVILDRARICGDAIIGGNRYIGLDSVISSGEFSGVGYGLVEELKWDVETGSGGLLRADVEVLESIMKSETSSKKSALEIRREIWESITTHDIYDLVS